MSEPVSPSPCGSLLEALAQVPDFRQAQGRRYRLSAILALCCAATLCGYKSYGAMAEWGKNYGRTLARALGFAQDKTPSVGTLHTVFRELDKAALEKALSDWAECVLTHLPRKTAPAIAKTAPAIAKTAPAIAKTAPAIAKTAPAIAKTAPAIALDGKTLRGSKNQGACDVHLLSAVSHGLGLTLFQEAVRDKTNEITAAQTVLAALVLDGRVVTMDALLTQKAIAQTIVAKGGTS